jgi:hypothetical protein
MVAASWGANLKLFGLCRLRFSAVMQRLAKAAGMRRRGRHCESRRREISQQRENYEKLGNSPMHCLVSGSLPTYRCEKQYSVASGFKVRRCPLPFLKTEWFRPCREFWPTTSERRRTGNASR